MPDLLTTKQVADRCQVGPRAFTTWAKRVGIQPVAFGRQLRWRWADVEDGIARATAPTKGRDRVVPLRSGRGDFAARIAKLRRDVRESTS